jgi:hypothetical protein
LCISHELSWAIPIPQPKEMFRTIEIATKAFTVLHNSSLPPLLSGLCQFDFTLFFITMIAVIKISGLIILWVDHNRPTKKKFHALINSSLRVFTMVLIAFKQ